MVIVHERPGTVNTPVGGVPVDQYETRRRTARDRRRDR